jgi:hypothetical protein
MPTYQGQFVSGQTLNAADLNAFTPAAIYTSNGTLSVANNTVTKLNFASSGGAGITSWLTGTGNITPNISGYYLVTANVQNGLTGIRTALWIYKNGAKFFAQDISVGTFGLSLSGAVFCNGTTDVIAGYAYQNSGAAVNFDNYQLSVSLIFQ